MKKLLVLSPHFPPVSAPDHQRVRMMLPYFEEYGWKPTVLAVDADGVSAPTDKSLMDTLPEKVTIQHCQAFPYHVTQRFGFDNLSLRSFRSLRAAGNSILKGQHFDLIFFSTTQTGILNLGPYWKKRFGLPFVIDLQDPLVNQYYQQTNTPPPGGRLKYWLSRRSTLKLEQKVIPASAHVITVSKAYATDIQQRIPGLPSEKFTEETFPYAEHDLVAARNSDEACEKHGSEFTALSAGRAGDDLNLSIESYLGACKIINSKFGLNITTRFVGTRYGLNREPALLRLARKLVAESHVDEHPARLPYLTVLRMQQQTNLNVVFGSSDPRYNPSKLLTVLASGAPVLAILNRQSASADFMAEVAPESLITFETGDDQTMLTERIYHTLARCVQQPEILVIRKNKLESREARQSTGRITQIFDRST